MPITIQHQPSAQSVGGAAHTAGNEQLRRYQEQQAVIQQEMAQRERMQQAGFQNQQYMQGQQLDYSSRAAALGILANQATQERGFQQQSKIQDQSLQSAAQLQDQRLQYGYQQQQDQIANAQYLQQQSLGAGFAKQYLAGQQQAASNQQNFQNQQAADQQRLNFDLFEMNAKDQAELNKIQQNRSRLEAMKANGDINDFQYQQADSQIKSRELGLSRQLTPQKNTSLLDQANQSIVQHPGTGAWLQQDPQTGMFKEIDMKKQGQGQITQLEQMKHNQTQEENLMKYAIDLMKASVNPDTGNPTMTYQQAHQAVSNGGVQSAGGTSQGSPAGMGQSQGNVPGELRQLAERFQQMTAGNDGTPTFTLEESINHVRDSYQKNFPQSSQGVQQIKNDTEVFSLKPGTVYIDPQGNRRVRR